MSGPGLDATGQGKASSTGGSRARRKLLTTEEAELFELAQAAGTGLDPEVFKILLDLLRMNVAPLAIFQMLRSMCAGQRVSSTESVPEPVRVVFVIAEWHVLEVFEQILRETSVEACKLKEEPEPILQLLGTNLCRITTVGKDPPSEYHGSQAPASYRRLRVLGKVCRYLEQSSKPIHSSSHSEIAT
ncbi:hypothetical protein lerEdw1_005171 [Lerista edwardsae]|nr:hypothetical protein lerEdw1_005171 [Lerista edwardsae]